jgi:hypothetical protein
MRPAPLGKRAHAEVPMLKNSLRAAIVLLLGALAVYGAAAYPDIVSNTSAFAP